MRVGDDDQTIYQGAAVGMKIVGREPYPGVRQVVLDDNFRRVGASSS